MSPQDLVKKRPIWLLVVLLALATVIGVAAGLTLVNEDKAVCESQNESRLVLRRVIVRSQAEGTVNTFPVIIRRGEGREAAILEVPSLGHDRNNFYSDLLELAEPIDC
jgi:hypothetical protein